jgi:hypothetical protein
MMDIVPFLRRKQAPTLPVSAAAVEPPEDPLVALFAEWVAAMDDMACLDETYSDRLKQLPSHFQPGNDGTGTISAYPELDFSRPAWRDWNAAILGRRPDLRSVKLHNQWQGKLARLEDAARERAAARGRIRLWISAQRAQKAARERLGLAELEVRRGAALDMAHELEAEILRTPARSTAGAAVKLRLWVRQTLGDSPVNLDPAERAIVSALGDLERLADRVA